MEYRKAIASLVFLLALISGPLYAQEHASVTNEQGGSLVERLQAERRSLSARIAALESQSAQDAKAAERLSALRSLDAVLAQREKRQEELKQLDGQLHDAERELESLDKYDPNEPKPYSMLLVENLKDQLAAEKDSQTALEADLKAAQQLLETAHKELDETQSEHPAESAKKKAGSSASELSAGDVPALELARERVALKQTEIELLQLRIKLCKNKQKQLDKKIEVISKDATFSIRDRDQQLERLKATEADLKQERRDVEARLEELDAKQKTEREKMTKEEAPEATQNAAAEAWRLAAETYQAEVAILDQELENLATARRFWKRRYDVTHGDADAKSVAHWLDDADEFLEQISDTSNSLKHRRDLAREKQASLERLSQDAEEKAAAPWRKFETFRLQELRDLTETTLDEMRAMERTFGRFRGELKEKYAAESAGLGESLRAIMNHKVVSTDEGSVTAGSLLVLIPCILAGMALAFFLSRVLGHRVLPRLGIPRGPMIAVKTITFYVLCVVFAVMAFELLNIPLAAFTFLGGAAAIAVGFGSQDIMNNFMSGIILLTEQPIRVDDVIEIGDVQGVVLHIGLRSTRLRTDSNYELIVPNKSLLDEQVTNLTLSDNFVQKSVTMTLDRSVATVNEAKERMLKVAFCHPMVLKSPRPVVLLKEVDSYYDTMTFEVFFSLQLLSFMKCAMVQSEILESISELFKKKDASDAAEAPSADAEAAEAESSEAPEAAGASVANGDGREAPGSASAGSGIDRAMLLKEVKRAVRSMKSQA